MSENRASISWKPLTMSSSRGPEAKCQTTEETLPFSRLTSANLLLALFALSAHLEYDLAEVTASLEMALRCPV
jgi:hypothetical protein